MTDLKSNIQAVAIMKSLMQGTSMFTTDYYGRLSKAVNEISKTCDVDTSDAYKYIADSLIEIRNILSVREDTPNFVTSSTILGLLISPFCNPELAKKTKFFRGKTYNDFNIDLHFFIDIQAYNDKCYFVEGTPEKAVSVFSYEFKKGKLSKLILERKLRGLKYIYDSKYKYKSIIFSDGVEVPL